jgi:molybdate transport system regulatory protein
LNVSKPAARLSIRIDFETGRLGPGKIALLEAIAREQSLAGAARALDMSYKRAWELLAQLNEMFDEPVALTLPGRNIGGGTELTPFGERVIALYHAIDRRATQAAAAATQELSAAAKAGRAAARRSLRRQRA